MKTSYLQERADYLSELTGEKIEIRSYNGYNHVINVNNGTIYAVGTKSECYNAMYNMMQGFWLASAKYANK